MKIPTLFILFFSITSAFGQVLDGAYIADETEVSWLQPAEIQNRAFKLEKIEWGIDLKNEIQAQIQRFEEGKTGETLNPYDPEQIDIYAEIEFLGNVDQKGFQERKYAFYYQEFERDTTGALSDWRWIEVKDDNNFRLRYTPEEVGDYTIQFEVNVRGESIYQSEEFSFQVLPSDAKGFMEIGATQRYFQLSSGENFFPTGGNMQADHCSDPRWRTNFIKENSKYANSGYDFQARLYHPLFYVDYLKTLDAYATSGANYFRFLSLSWTNELEYEKLNDYTGRMHMAWEMDRIVDKAKDNNLKIEWCIQAQYSLENPGYYNHFNWDWPSNTEGCREMPNNGYCYQTELGLKDPVEFFTDERAKKQWKKKLRYIVARWGYSPEIAMIQLMSEINGTGIIPNFQLAEVKNDKGELMYEYCRVEPGDDYISKPYYDKPGYKQAVYEWHKEMSAYVKEELQHRRHLISPSYAGQPRAEDGDSTFYLPNIDVCSFNYYSPFARKFFLWADKFESSRSKHNYYVGGYGNSDPLLTRKPLVFSEIGIADYYLCDEDIGDIKIILISPFCGASGMGMNWDNNRLERSQNWFLYGNVKSFMKDIDLNNTFWIPQADETQKPEVKFLGEMVGLTSDEKLKRAVGVVHNRSWNFYTRGRKKNDEECGFDFTLGLGDEEIKAFSTYRDLFYEFPSGPYPLKVEEMGVFNRYVVDWYDPFTLEKVKTQYTRTTISGKLLLEYPAMSTDEGYRPIYWFKARRLKVEDFESNELPSK